ncbi:carbohydrate binding domain-containing protein [Acetivibrio cellulolyticus]|uniref:carbohydrate binding domain-containing protein n=1 Tax=Acetivibrio cellulolyticus TaxID=35830 RepID=UPI0001E2EC4D|nr:carbohydrate binding domain-containing protein [Acetivibrio cellulolyticus]
MFKKMKIFFCVTFITMSITTNIFAEGNLIKNGSFEDEQGGNPTDWTYYSYVKDEGSAELKIEAQGAHSGSKCVTVINNVENDSRYLQTIGAQPNKKYKLSCYIKAENIGDTGNGAILSIEGQVAASNTLRNTNGKWDYAELYVKTGDGIESFNVTVGVGGYGAMSTGKASFDDVTVEEVDSIPDGSVIAIVEKSHADNPSSPDTEKKSGTNKIVWIILAVCILIVAAATYSTFKSSPSEDSDASDNSSDLKTDDTELDKESDEAEEQKDDSSVDSDDSTNKD